MAVHREHIMFHDLFPIPDGFKEIHAAQAWIFVHKDLLTMPYEMVEFKDPSPFVYLSTD